MRSDGSGAEGTGLLHEGGAGEKYVSMVKVMLAGGGGRYRYRAGAGVEGRLG